MKPGRAAFAVAAVLALALASSAHADPIVRTGAGAGPADVQAAVDAFRADLGPSRREVTWDDVPDAQADPNALPAAYLEANGLAFADPGFREFRVSATAAGGHPPRFASLHPDYATQLQPFSGERLFARMDLTAYPLRFLVPGTRTAAAVRGFGAVFSDVDAASDAAVELRDLDGRLLWKQTVPVADAGLSFVGVAFPSPVVGSVRIVPTGDQTPNISYSPSEGRLVALDDFLVGEAQPAPGYVSFTADAYRVPEAGGFGAGAQFVRTGNAGFHFGLRGEVVGGTATPGVDYAAPGPSFGLMLAGERSRGFSVQALPDSVHEGDETVVLRVVTDGYAEAATPSLATVVIADDDPPPAPADRKAPTLGALRAISGRAPILRFSIAEWALVEVSLHRMLPGRRSGRRCLAPSRRLARRARCQRPTRVRGTLRRLVAPGANRVRIPRRLAGRRLALGRYRASLVAADAAGNRSSGASAGFTLR